MELHGRRAGGRAEHYPGAGLGSVRRRAFLGSRFSPRSGNGELMNQLAMQEEDYSDEPTQAKGEVEWQLQKLKPKHLQICSLLAQGFKNIEVAKLTGVTKEYITMLLRQPLIKQEISRVSEAASARLELMFEKSVDVIADAMENGNHTEKLKGARLHGELTRRIGRVDSMALNQNPADDRLERLAERLEGLLDSTRGGLYNESGEPIEEAEVLREWSHGGGASSSTLQNGDENIGG